MNRHFLLILIPLLLALVACADSAAEGPPEIRYGEDLCDDCHMIIDDPRFASAYVTEEGEFRLFDDIGDMYRYADRTGDSVRAFWVHDYHSEEWLESDSATFVYSPALLTPMGWGLAAFADRETAAAFQAEEGGDLLTAAELQQQIAAGHLSPMDGAHSHAEDVNHDH
ncbi:MAG: nitrous oxide reductase accessory protein NosL [Candidatus Promineifilaceae bacterium]|nr:nitrous oxide reductase accessory protein NosL [Candidatus Promineifilaceae bacterium]